MHRFNFEWLVLFIFILKFNIVDKCYWLLRKLYADYYLYPQFKLSGSMADFQNHSLAILSKGEHYIALNDHYGFQTVHPLTQEKIVNLCGGIPIAVTNYIIMIVSQSRHVISVKIECDQYNTSRTIDFEAGEITNVLMEVYDKGNRIGVALLANQVIEATSQGFQSLEVHAAGGIGWPPEWDGYVYWAKTGYSMNEESHTKFEKWLEEHGLYGMSLFDLANDKINGGSNIWSKEGFDWHGFFDLKSNSENRKLLRKYLAERELSANV
jgi:hypothetical protein